MITNYKQFINEGLKDILKGISKDDAKSKLNDLTPVERFNKLKELNLTYQDIYTQKEINNFTGLDKVLSDNKYDYVYDFYENRARVKLNGKCGFIDENGNEITPIIYNRVYNFKENRGIVKLNDKYGFIDERGNEITLIKYDDVYYFNENRAGVRLNGKWGYIDENGHEITPIKYENVYDFYKNRAEVKLNDKWCFIDEKGNEYF